MIIDNTIRNKFTTKRILHYLFILNTLNIFTFNIFLTKPYNLESIHPRRGIFQALQSFYNIFRV
ncbi:hypothetical protein CJT77_21105 [Pseudomonas aeruginosa]|nr:hypothetical protein CJU29_23550 [Pseudomonas aeruginosa]PBX58936.1 hypothetical protein CJT77_21105 [Pseudomonas aeruginosa]PBZ20661.1 hypothetical protein CJT51_16535 [Pseudomonas aeruginosa]PCB12512.1 hypothetical protein CJT95_05040 [Pseudomonas aeruginosa]RQB65157.1 hypothetical protein IPC440_28165 [Pseudomonas aeruginosa]